MKNIDLLGSHLWHPLARYDITHPFFSLNGETILFTWAALLLLCVLMVLGKLVLKTNSFARHALLRTVQSFADLTEQTLGSFNEGHFYFVTALFSFIVLCNTLSVFPWAEEPTKDINTTLALGIISFLYVQYHTIHEHGLRAYLYDYLTPIFLMLPLNIVGKLSSIISMSFRLFGNIFGGFAISKIYFSALEGSLLLELLGLLSGLNLLIIFFFCLFEGVLQAFVFAMLTLTQLSIGMHSEAEGMMYD